MLSKSSLVFMTSTFFLSSCAYFEAPPTYNEKLRREKKIELTKTERLPEIPLFDLPKTTSKAKKSGRFNASLKTEKEKQRPLGNRSNKRIYFLALLDQYHQLTSLSSRIQGRDIAHCPQFHSSWVEYNERHPQATMAKGDSLQLQDYPFHHPDALKYYPELNLPVEEGGKLNVLEAVQSHHWNKEEALLTALNLHAKHLGDEIYEMCETGSADNFYVYENLSRHIKKQKLEANKVGLRTLFKGPLFFNMALLQSLHGHQDRSPSRAVASSSNNREGRQTKIINNELTSRFQAPWFEEYLKAMKEHHHDKR